MKVAQPEARAARTVAAAAVSLAVGTVVFGMKLVAWWKTGSSAILSDALESTTNVVAALFALFAVRFAAKPPDRDHPYGHGKIEFLSAAFEGGLVFFAALTIVYASVRAMIEGPELRSLDVGLLLAAAAALTNLGLGTWLLRTGKSTRSPTLIADGHHVLSDVWLTAGAILGVALVRVTDVMWLDPIAGLVLALFLARMGYRLVIEAAGGLLDREDPELVARIVAAFNESQVPGVRRLHHLRAIRAGSTVHVDAHVYVPEHWTVRQAHEASRELERAVTTKSGLDGELALHLDPHRGPFGEAGVVDPPVTIEQAVGPGDL